MENSVLTLQVLSPHQDDAAFSLASLLADLANRDIAITIVNCFTVSRYAPVLELDDEAAISEIRHREDAEFAGMLGPNVNVIDLGYPDAPLRLDVDSSNVCGPRPHPDPARGSLAGRLSATLRGMVILPLGLGGHVDHVLAREQALDAGAGLTLAFYEELPYAYRSGPTQAEAEAILRGCGIEAVPHLAGRRSASLKRSLLGVYKSQAPLANLDEMASYRGGIERVWMTREFEQAWLKIGLTLE